MTSPMKNVLAMIFFPLRISVGYIWGNGWGVGESCSIKKIIFPILGHGVEDAQVVTIMKQ